MKKKIFKTKRKGIIVVIHIDFSKKAQWTTNPS